MPASVRDLLSRSRHDLGGEAQRVAVEDGVRELDVGHAEIGDQRADGGVADRYADHQAEGEQRVDQRLAPFALGGEVVIDVQRLRVVGETGEQRVVHLGDRAPQRVLDDAPDLAFFEI